MPNTTANLCAVLGLASCSALFKEYGPIYFGAVWGAFFAVSRAEFTLGKAMTWMIGSVGFSAIFTGLIAKGISSVTGWDVALFLSPIAFWLAYKSDKASALLDEISTEGIRKWFRSKVGP